MVSSRFNRYTLGLSGSNSSLKTSLDWPTTRLPIITLTSTDFGMLLQRCPHGGKYEALCVPNCISVENSPFETGTVSDLAPFGVSSVTVTSAEAAPVGRSTTLPWTFTVPIGHFARAGKLNVKRINASSTRFEKFIISSDHYNQNSSSLCRTLCYPNASANERPRA